MTQSFSLNFVPCERGHRRDEPCGGCYGAKDAVDALIEAHRAVEAECAALKSQLAATQERLAQMERDEDMRRTLNR